MLHSRWIGEHGVRATAQPKHTFSVVELLRKLRLHYQHLQDLHQHVSYLWNFNRLPLFDQQQKKVKWYPEYHIRRSLFRPLFFLPPYTISYDQGCSRCGAPLYCTANIPVHHPITPSCSRPPISLVFSLFLSITRQRY